LSAVLDILLLRRPKIDYISPPICEVFFSATGFPVIVLSEFSRIKPEGLEIVGGVLKWPNISGGICYTVYRETEPGVYQIINECINTPCGDNADFQCVTLPGPGCYRISVITDEGESDLSDPICN
jgi:hypothetical protein